jgi:tol-pal system protein YbgF
VKIRLLVPILLALGGCAGPAASAERRAASVAEARAEAADAAEAREAERAERRRQRARIRELEAQLGLARAESEQLRDEVAALREAERRRVTRIGEACREERAAALEGPSAPAEPEASRPVLRLYGTGPSRPAASADGVRPIPGPQAPPTVGPPPAAGVRLPVSAGPGADPQAGVPAIPPAPVRVAEPASAAAEAAPTAAPDPEPRAPRPREADPAVRQYREALQHLSERRLERALTGLREFLEAHPSHPYADNALYWRGEVHYVRRDYRTALGTFSELIRRYPRGNKVPEALLRIGLCYERMGQRARARRVFDRLRAQYPESVAARMASREDA